MYVAVKGGEKAINNAHRWLAEERRGDPALAELSPAQIDEQLTLSVDRVMAEGALYDRALAALAIKQARGDLIEAIFLTRAYRTTLPRFGYSDPLDTAAMTTRRRISATFKDIPGGQLLGPTFDYTHRLIDFKLAADGVAIDPAIAPGAAAGKASMAAAETTADGPADTPAPRVVSLLNKEGLIEQEQPQQGADGDEDAPGDITREPLAFPADRPLRLQTLARGDEGFLLSLGYSTQRGYGRTHPFAGEIRFGTTAVEFTPPELGFPIEIGDIALTECQMINQFAGSATAPPQFTQGYGLVFGQSERKAMAMALVDRSLRSRDLGETVSGPAADEEFVLSHSDNIQATGFVEHLKLPHYVDFQSELELVRKMRRTHALSEAETALAVPSEAAE